ncbi:MAG: molecular chaperone DnaJ [Sandaracinaceae bacterium]
MAPKADYYQVLGVDRSATAEDIKRAFRRLAMAYHPDRNPGDPRAEQMFKEASEAFAVLSDEDKRKRYDRMGHAAFKRARDGGQERVDFSSVSEILETLFNDLLGGGRSRRSRVGGDIEVELDVTFEEAALGATKSLDVTRNVSCATCDGQGAAPGTEVRRCTACGGRGEQRYQRGFFSVSRPCSSCGGSGKMITTPCADCTGRGVRPTTETVEVKVPPGVQDGSVRTVRGGGEQGRGGAGDLHVTVKVQPHPFFSRDGSDVRVSVPISFPQAVLGAQIEVPTLQGKVKMRVPPGTQSGKTFRLRGKGLEALGGYGKGDELVKVLVEVPGSINRKQRQLIAQLAEEMGEEVHPQQKTFLEKLRSFFE